MYITLFWQYVSSDIFRQNVKIKDLKFKITIFYFQNDSWISLSKLNM